MRPSPDEPFSPEIDVTRLVSEDVPLSNLRRVLDYDVLGRLISVLVDIIKIEVRGRIFGCAVRFVPFSLAVRMIRNILACFFTLSV